MKKFLAILFVLAVCVTGVFAADMQVKVDNDGPVTIIMNTEEIMKKK